MNFAFGSGTTLNEILRDIVMNDNNVHEDEVTIADHEKVGAQASEIFECDEDNGRDERERTSQSLELPEHNINAGHTISSSATNAKVISVEPSTTKDANYLSLHRILGEQGKRHSTPQDKQLIVSNKISPHDHTVRTFQADRKSVTLSVDQPALMLDNSNTLLAFNADAKRVEIKTRAQVLPIQPP